MRIERVIIHNFKQFPELDFSLDNLNVVVGNNESGKTTLLQAIFLALTGKFNGRSIYRELCESMFFRGAVQDFIAKTNNGGNPELPKISITLIFDDYPVLNGSNHEPSLSDCDGFTFTIEMDNQFSESWREFREKKSKIDALPLEYYHCVWRTFARKTYANSSFLSFEASMINADTFENSASPVSSFLTDVLSDSERANLMQDQRELYKEFAEKASVKAINDEVSKNEKLVEKKVKIAAPETKKDTWSSLLSAESDGIPLSFEGDGTKRVIQTYLAIGKLQSGVPQILLVEEPECHLSYSNLWTLVTDICSLSDKCQVIVTTHSSFVANKLNLASLLLLSDKKITHYNSLPQETCDFFRKRSSYDSLRLLLAKKVVLVEGDSDDLIFQKAFLEKAKKDGKLMGKLPSECGIDVITASLAFLRFLDLAKLTGVQVSVITDNDGNLSALQEKYQNYLTQKIRVFYSKTVSSSDCGEGYSANTLEPELLRANSLATLNTVLGVSKTNGIEMVQYMENNKTECALKIFDRKTGQINYPQYILDAVAFNE